MRCSQARLCAVTTIRWFISKSVMITWVNCSSDYRHQILLPCITDNRYSVARFCACLKTLGRRWTGGEPSIVLSFPGTCESIDSFCTRRPESLIKPLQLGIYGIRKSVNGVGCPSGIEPVKNEGIKHPVIIIYYLAVIIVNSCSSLGIYSSSRCILPHTRIDKIPSALYCGEGFVLPYCTIFAIFSLYISQCTCYCFSLDWKDSNSILMALSSCQVELCFALSGNHWPLATRFPCTGADPNFNKRGCLNEKGCHCHSCFADVGVGAGGGFPFPHEALKLEQLGYSVMQKIVL